MRRGVERGGQRAFVEIIELAADRHALGEARQLDAGCRRGGRRCNARWSGLRPWRSSPGSPPGRVSSAGDQALDAQLLGADPVERRERAAQHVIAAAEGAGRSSAQRSATSSTTQIDAVVAPRIAADRAGIDGIEIAADRARADRLGRPRQRRGQRLHQDFAPLDQMQRRAPRRARPEPRQFGQQLDQRSSSDIDELSAVSASSRSGAGQPPGLVGLSWGEAAPT